MEHLNFAFRHPKKKLKNNWLWVTFFLHLIFVSSAWSISTSNSPLEHSPLDTQLPTGDVQNESVDEDDVLCADLMVKVFHAYIQATNQEKFDFKAPTVRWKYFLNPEHHFPLDNPKWDDWTFKLLHTSNHGAIEFKSVLGLIAFNKLQRKLIVTFRGSQQARDWLVTNFNIGKVKSDLPGLQEKVHAGYWKLFETSRKELSAHVHEFLSQLSYDSIQQTRILVTGHSLGGAVATLAAAYLSTLFDTSSITIDLRTFGSPRVGGPRFKDWIEKRIHGKRFIRKTDPFSSLTPHFLGYTDIFPEIQLPSFGASSLQFDQAHDARLYQKAIYDILHLEYKEMYSK